MHFLTINLKQHATQKELAVRQMGIKCINELTHLFKKLIPQMMLR